MTNEEIELLGRIHGMTVAQDAIGFARALLSRAIPEGHVVVPKEPTPVAPIAWVLTEQLEKRETICNARLWFTDPVNSAWTPIYTSLVPIGPLVCHVRYRCVQRWDGNGNNAPEIYEGWEVCEAHERGDDGSPAIPVLMPLPAAPANKEGA
ncbi:hypothetical protein FEE59_13540 [Herbaspirillum sp. RU 5E]|nr:hypothetical protein [Herbaspirillum sp. RU 5E]